ncbi:MAG: glutamine amidotransferase [Myxococcales bacterium]
MRRSILLIKCGTADRNVVAKLGDYESWFIRSLGGDPANFTVIAPYKGEPLPDPTRYAAVIATGSTASVTERRPWMAAAAEYLLKAGDKRVPVLGVCFGHQLICEALGAPVQRNPKGREFGTVEVEVTEEGARDPLFKGLPALLKVQQSHEDEASALPAGARLLAKNGHCAVQALAWGDFVRGVQFHPELSPEAVRAVAESRRLPAGSFKVEDAPGGRAVLRNFQEQYVAPRAD